MSLSELFRVHLNYDLFANFSFSHTCCDRAARCNFQIQNENVGVLNLMFINMNISKKELK